MRASLRCATGTALSVPSWDLSYISATVYLLTMFVIRMVLATAFGSSGSPSPAPSGSRMNRRSWRPPRLSRSALEAITITLLESVSGARRPSASRHDHRPCLASGPAWPRS
jgi:hypothetical protein